MEIGLYTFGELTSDATGAAITPQRRVADLLEEMDLADRLGLDVFAVGEHHRPDFVVSSPAVMLAAGAARTKRLRLSSAVNVLSSDDPVRVFEQFALLDLISNGRAEIMAGRGSFIESFPLFGYDLKDYDALFEEKLVLLLKVREKIHVEWSGKHRAPLTGQGVYPRPVQDPLPVWIAVGGNPESAVRAGTLGLPMALAIIVPRPGRSLRFRACRLVLHARRSRWRAGGWHRESAERRSIDAHIAQKRERYRALVRQEGGDRGSQAQT